ncbi:MAG: PAS domain S-box protein, partial [Desulfobacterales bacterium]|nr:PAS domain S-box protein [Desulfobacterales bacterium]
MPVKNILIADDDQEIRSLLTESIEDEGCLVFSAANGKEAVEIAKNKPIDLAILDVRMPEMDGITALKLIKKIDRNIEILIITGYGDLQNLRKLIVKEGAFDYLLKPFTLNDIKHSIKRALQRQELNLKKNFVSADLGHRIREMESDFKQKTLQLRESQLKYKNIIQNSVDMIIIIQAGKIRFMNPMTSELTGYTEGDLLNTSFIDMVHPDDRTRMRNKYRKWLRKDKEIPRIYTFRVLKKDGEALWVESSSVWTEWEGASATLNIARDISERKKAFEELKIMESAIESSINAVAFFDLKGKLTKINDSFLKLWAYENKNELLGKPVTAFIQEEIKVLALLKALREEGGWIGEMTAIKKNGSKFDVQFSANMVKDVEGNPVCMMASFIDITDKKECAEIMMRSDKLFSLGQLSAGLAHELKNPLAVISSCSQFCMENLKLDLSVNENFQMILRNSQRAGKLINDLLVFAKPSLLEWNEVDINEVITNMLSMARLETTPFHIDFKCNLKKGLPKIVGDEEKLGQVFLNIIMNAIQAVSRKGTVILQTNILAAHNQVEIKVIDDGTGIPDDYR